MTDVKQLATFQPCHRPGVSTKKRKSEIVDHGGILYLSNQHHRQLVADVAPEYGRGEAKGDFRFDGWQHIADVLSEPQGLSIHGVRFDAAALSNRSMIDLPFIVLNGCVGKVVIITSSCEALDPLSSGAAPD